MDEYINLEAIHKISFTEAVLVDGDVRHEKIALMRDIERLPAADVAPVRHGLWIPFYESEVSGWNPEFAGYDPIAGYKCSECGEEAILDCNDKFVLSNYCPNCGAKMDGGAE